MSVNYYIEHVDDNGPYKSYHIGQWANGRFLFQGKYWRTVRAWRDRLRGLTALSQEEKIVSENGVRMTPTEFWIMVGETLANDTMLDYALSLRLDDAAEGAMLARGFLDGSLWMDGPFAFSSREFC